VKEELLIQLFEQALTDQGGFHISFSRSPNCEGEGHVSFDFPEHTDRHFSYFCIFKDVGEPRFFDLAVAKEMTTLIFAPFISEEFSRTLEEKKISYIDSQGNCLFLGPSFFYSKRESNRANKAKRSLIDPLAPRSVKTSLILRCLLDQPNRFLTLRELANLSGASLGQTAQVRSFLSENHWVEDSRHGFRVSDPLSLLSAWAKVYQNKRDSGSDCLFFSVDSSGVLLEKLQKLYPNKLYLTSYTAAAYYYASVSQPVLYLGTQDIDLMQISRFFPAARVTTGANVVLEGLDEGESFLPVEKGHLRLVSPVQVILSLWGRGGRSDEAIAPLLEAFKNVKKG